jgi:hypothetical protein
MEASGQLHVPAALPPVKELQVHTLWMGNPQSRSGRGGKEEKLIIVPARN